MKQVILAAKLFVGLAVAHAAAVVCNCQQTYTQHANVATIGHNEDPSASNINTVSAGPAPSTKASQVKEEIESQADGFNPTTWQSSQAAIQSSRIASQDLVVNSQSIDGQLQQSASTQSVPTAQTPPVQPLQPAASGGGSVLMTYYNPAGNKGSCGEVIQENSPMVAMAASQLQCGKYLMIHGPAGSFKVKAADTCIACAIDLHLDIPERYAFGTIQGTGENQGPLFERGNITIFWEWL